MSAVAYLRKSRVNAAGGLSWPMQEQAVRELAARNGDADVELLSDWGVSGGSTVRRPQYRAMLERIRAGEVRTVYSFSLTRLTRSLMDWAELAAVCQAHGARILTPSSTHDFGSPDARGIANILASVSQMEREWAAERNAAALEQRRQRGDYIGRVPYGQALVDGQLVEAPSEPVEAVVAAYRETGSFVGAARLLNAQGVPSKSQAARRRRPGTLTAPRPWTHGTVADVVRRAAPDDLAVSLETRKAGTKGATAAIFYRLLRCPCGQILTPRRDAGAATAVGGYYCSRGYAAPGHPRPAHVPERAVLAWAKEEVARLRLPAEEAVVRERAGVEEQALETRRARVADNYESGLIDREARDRKVAAIDADLAKVGAVTRLARLPEVDWSWPPAQLNAVLRALFGEIVLDASMRPVRAEWLVPEWRAS